MAGTMHLNRLTQPTAELLTLAQAKLHLRVDTGFTDDDAYIGTLITVAREYCEDFTNLSIGVCDFELVLDSFPANRNYIELTRAPLKSVAYVEYFDSTGAMNTLDPSKYIANVDRLPGAVFLPYYNIWPVMVPQPGAAVRIKFTAGYDSSSVPQRIIAAMLLLLGHWYIHREEVATDKKIEQIPLGVDSLLWPLRVFTNGDFNGNAPLDSYIGGAYYYGVR